MTHAQIAPPESTEHAEHVTHAATESAISRTRVEFLFDGVFAIAMTILVLELRVPDLVDHRSTDAFSFSSSRRWRAGCSGGDPAR